MGFEVLRAMIRSEFIAILAIAGAGIIFVPSKALLQMITRYINIIVQCTLSRKIFALMTPPRISFIRLLLLFACRQYRKFSSRLRCRFSIFSIYRKSPMPHKARDYARGARYGVDAPRRQGQQIIVASAL